MSNMYYINFTYKSPHEDIETFIESESHNVINILTSLKTMLSRNIEVVENLLEHKDQIKNIIPIGYRIIGVEMEPGSVTEHLLEKQIIKNDVITSSDSESEINFCGFLSDSEQDPEYNLENLENNDPDSEEKKSNDTDSEDTITILNKYKNIISDQE